MVDNIIQSYLAKLLKEEFFDSTWIPNHGQSLHIEDLVTDNHKVPYNWESPIITYPLVNHLLSGNFIRINSL